jgi:hypothetical protein
MSERIIRNWENEETEKLEVKEEDLGIILTRIRKIKLGRRLFILDIDKAEGIEIEKTKNGYNVFVYFSTWQAEIEMDQKMQVMKYKTEMPEIPVSASVPETVYTVVHDK